MSEADLPTDVAVQAFSAAKNIEGPSSESKSGQQSGRITTRIRDTTVLRGGRRLCRCSIGSGKSYDAVVAQLVERGPSKS